MKGTGPTDDPQRPFRVLLLARVADGLPGDRGAGIGQIPWWSVVAASGPPAVGGEQTGAGEDPRVPTAEAVVVQATAGGRAPTLLTGARTLALAVRRKAPVRWVWALKRSAWFRQQAREVDVVWSLDPETDAALSVVDDLTSATTVLDAQEWVRCGPALGRLALVLAEIRGMTDAGSWEGNLGRWRSALQEVSGTLGPAGPPVALQVPSVVVEVLRQARPVVGRVAADVLTILLDEVGFDAEQRVRSGLAARRASAELSMGARPYPGLPAGRPGRADTSDTALAALVRRTLAAADDLLDTRPTAALGLLGDALGLLLHRARHAEVLSSPLVEDPARTLAPLSTSRTLGSLVSADRAGSGDGRVRPRSSGKGDGRTRVLVVTGAYGDFHRPVVRALDDVAEVKTRDFARRYPVLGPTVMDDRVLLALRAVVDRQQGRLSKHSRKHQDRSLPGVDPVVSPAVAGLEAADAVAVMLRWADVALLDWADRASVWASHVASPDTRLVLRVHALDALDPWLHLMRWDRIERVLVVSPVMRELVGAVLSARGVEVPVEVVPLLVTSTRFDPVKSPEARTTLGMVGWGRQVKDPLWVIDLLARDPSWELVLIGPGFPDKPNPATQSYVREVERRLADPSLRDRVHIVGPTDDVAGHLHRVGVIVSASVRESFHQGLVEGVASGAVPVVRDWPLLARRGGARTLYPPEWVVSDLDEAEERIRQTTRADRWEEERARARRHILAMADPDRVGGEYRRVLLGAPRRSPAGTGPMPAGPSTGPASPSRP